MMQNIDTEAQRYGRNKETSVNSTYINSGVYKKKFDTISNSKKLSRVLYKIAKKMLVHRSGTKYEDMYWIDLDTLKIVAKEIDGITEHAIIYSNETKKTIKKYPNLITIHTHPDSFPPSINDLNSNFAHGYVLGIIICHNGKIFIYSAREQINENYYKMVVESYLKQGYNEDASQLMALFEIQKNFDILFREV